MKKKYKIILAAVALAVCGAAGAFYALRPLPVEVEQVVRGSLSQQVSEEGDVLPEGHITLNANLAGIVVRRPYGVGETVKKGEMPLEIDSAQAVKELQNQIASLSLQQSLIHSNHSGTLAELSLRREQLRQQIAASKQDYERLFGAGQTAQSLRDIAAEDYVLARRLWREARERYGDDDDDRYLDSGIYTPRHQMSTASEALAIAEYNNSDTVRAYYEGLIQSGEAQLAALEKNDAYAASSAHAAAQQLQITIDTFKEKLGRGPLTAPNDAVVWKLLAQEGDVVAENQPVAVLYTPEKMYIRTLVLAEDAMNIKAGDTAECRFSNGLVTDARVRFVSMVAQDVVSTIGLTEKRCAVELEPRELPEAIGVGYRAEVIFSTNTIHDTFSVSAGSVIPAGTGSSVYVIRDGKAMLTSVETGVRQGGRVEILSGLQENDHIVSDPYDSQAQNKSRVTWEKAKS